ncbi:hypothetical protein MTR_1g035310 [Medicago truncatula]|uniref:Uncharacterized protein n=1 Tax=Medicago truncatula TaxID=3880 RepID=A0A072VRN6_MEDTR|nr:hypothetical protein MTR_1g035310 [Medicago truncatula]
MKGGWKTPLYDSLVFCRKLISSSLGVSRRKNDRKGRKTQEFVPHGLPQAPLAPSCGQKFPAACFSSWIGAKCPVFFF